MTKLQFNILLCFTIIFSLTGCMEKNSSSNSDEVYDQEDQSEYILEEENYSEENNPVEFRSPGEVMSYLSDKNFRSPDGSKVVHIGYDGVSINGTPAYFNLDITVGGSTTAYIKGQSLNNPDGVIEIRVDSNAGCIYNDGISFCL